MPGTREGRSVKMNLSESDDRCGAVWKTNDAMIDRIEEDKSTSMQVSQAERKYGGGVAVVDAVLKSRILGRAF
jgi:hypothetical protein